MLCTTALVNFGPNYVHYSKVSLYIITKFHSTLPMFEIYCTRKQRNEYGV